jgi:DNA polymerase III epsilon subunit-like protein
MLFVEIAIVDAGARTFFEGTIRPSCRIEAGATRIHGHTTRSLAGSPPFLEIYPELLKALWGRRVVVYNASYDRRAWDTVVRSLGARGDSHRRVACMGVCHETLRGLRG